MSETTPVPTPAPTLTSDLTEKLDEYRRRVRWSGQCFEWVQAQEATAEQYDEAIAADVKARSALVAAIAKDREEQRATFLRSITGQSESFERTRPLCSGHVDKMEGRGCLACNEEKTRRALEDAAKSLEWVAGRKRDMRAESWPDVFSEIRGYANSRAAAARRALGGDHA